MNAENLPEIIAMGVLALIVIGYAINEISKKYNRKNLKDERTKI